MPDTAYLIALLTAKADGDDDTVSELTDILRGDPEHAEALLEGARGEVVAKAFRKASAHAPAGGVSVGGKEYRGGEFIPGEVMAEATEAEKAAVEGGEKQTGRERVVHAKTEHGGDKASFLATVLGPLRSAGGDGDARAKAMSAVAERMPPKAFERMKRTVKNVRVCQSYQDVTALLGQEFPGKFPPEDEIYGVFSGHRSELTLDGGVSQGDELYGELDAESVYAHEMAHAIDYHPLLGWKGSISGSDEFLDAYESEIADGQLCQYATEDPQEGFAEFGRLLWASNVSHEKIRSEFPATYKVFQSHGLV